MLFLVLAAFSCVHAQLGNYQKYISCINNDKFEMTEHIAQGMSPEDCATLCQVLFDGGEGCLSFEYNQKTQECRPQKKYAPNVKCKKPNPDEVLFSLPNPNAPAVTAATSKVKTCAQFGGPYQTIPEDVVKTCERLGGHTTEESDAACLKKCEESAECTTTYTEKNPNGGAVCFMLKCPDTLALDSNWLAEAGSKMPGLWHKCSETEDVCPVVAGGGMKANERELSSCEDRGTMDGKTHKECEAACLADPECTTFLWFEAYAYCGKMECPPGINAFRPDGKLPAELRYYKCKDGEVEPCANDDKKVERQIAELCETRGIAAKKCPKTCGAVVKHKWFKNDPLCDRINPVAWFPDACPFSCPNARVKCQRSAAALDLSDASETAMTQESNAWSFDEVCLYSFAMMGLGIALHGAYKYATAKTPVEFGSTYTTP